MNLDGKDKIKPTPYDAHEQVVRGPHTHSIEKGYEAAKPKLSTVPAKQEQK